MRNCVETNQISENQNNTPKGTSSDIRGHQQPDGAKGEINNDAQLKTIKAGTGYQQREGKTPGMGRGRESKTGMSK